MTFIKFILSLITPLAVGFIGTHFTVPAIKS